ncbi:hypothetical protein DSLASN_08840 [Desulfoluna limicola]|uniref:Uncharacterized protein n=1 Tax=Desulfoluna limicola TaxID=2810562 RepID=A0ABM7PDD7_9BACT|nr:hypothetical protein DSLASN_08840 [Desulfoluna limicola]
MEKASLRRRGEPPRKLIALALIPSYLRKKRKDVRRGLPPPQMLAVNSYKVTSTEETGYVAVT